MDRRKFLLTGAGGLMLANARGYAAGMNEHPVRRVGLIGSGWYGKSALLRLLQVAPAEVVALCDVDRRMADEAAELVATRQASGKKPAVFHDYREMLEKEPFDIVQVSTPDHWHALAAIAAMKAGADVYVEKPISVDVVEGQAMVAASRKYNRIVQVNLQRRSTPHLVNALEKVIREGRLGNIAHAEVYCYYHMRARGNPPDAEPPEYLDYEMWTGPAPMRPYNELTHPRRWRAFMEYGNGIVGDMCVHMYDMVRWLLDLGWPKRIHSAGGVFVDPGSKANISDTQTATFEHDGVNVVWQHRSWGDAPDPDYPWGATIYGDKGTLKLSVHRYDFIPRGGGEPIREEVVYEYDKYPEDRDEKDLERHVAPAMRRHWINFLENIESRGKPVSTIEQGHITSASCIMANLSMKTGRAIEWDPAAGKVVNDGEMNALLERPYRDPWVHPRPDTV